METTITEARRQLLKTEDKEPHRVCAYCRVSTDEEDQRNSLVAQKRFFSKYFDNHPNWSNAGIFADEGLSGTSLRKRDEFNAMLDLARNGKIDIILTKEVSRFSRNVKDLLDIVEELRAKGVYVWFLSDDVNTEPNNYREKLTQIATNAEMESLRTSRRVRWGQEQQMKNGVVFGRKDMFGYNIEKDETGKQHFVIIPEEAEIVKLIFEWFAAGDGTTRIARRIEKKGVLTKRFRTGWGPAVILRILRNEKYVGDLQLGKTFTDDPLTHSKKLNKGEAASYYHKNHHPEAAIIDRELFDKVQAILKEKEPDEETRAKHTNRYWTSGKIFCGVCGRHYIRHSKQKVYDTYRTWVCAEAHKYGTPKQVTLETGEITTFGCNSKRVNDRVLKAAVHDIIVEIVQPNKDKITEEILAELEIASKPTDNSKKIASIEKEIEEINKLIVDMTIKYSSGTIPQAAYDMTLKAQNKKLSALNASVETLRKESTTQLDKESLYKGYREQIEEILSFTEEELNEELYGRITKRIFVYPENVLEFYLSFLPMPIHLQYTATGRGANYSVMFTVLTKEQFTKIKAGKEG